MLENFNFRVIIEYLPQFLHGLAATTWISLISFLGALIIGAIACMGRLSHLRIFRVPAVIFIEVIRSTPLLAQLYFFYFGLPKPLLGVYLKT